METIVVAVIAFRNMQGRILTVRKRGTSTFMFPGGRIEPQEDALHAAIRGACEKIKVHVRPESLTKLGTFTCAAANEPGRSLRATVFVCHDPVGIAYPGAEVVELAWVSPRYSDVVLAPLLTDHVFPFLTSPPH